MTSKGTMNSANSAFDGNPNTNAENKVRSGSGQVFETLTDLKRGSGQNNAAANRQSFTEQTKTTGSIGAAWDKFTKGTSG